MVRAEFAGGCVLLWAVAGYWPAATAQPAAAHPIVLHAAHLLEVDTGRIVTPGEILVEGDRITAVGTSVAPSGRAPNSSISAIPRCCRASSMRMCICFCIPVQKICRPSKNRCRSARSWRRSRPGPILMAGFTAERDMGTEGAGSADTAVRDAIDRGLIPGPRLRICGNAIDILGGHEDANRFNPAQHVLSNATYANNADELVAAIRAAAQGRRGLRKNLRDRAGHDARRRAAYSVSVHDRAAQGRGRRGRAPGRPRRGARHGRAGDAVCGASRGGLDHSRQPAQRRDHAGDAAKRGFSPCPRSPLWNTSATPRCRGRVPRRKAKRSTCTGVPQAARRRNRVRHGFGRGPVSARDAGARVRIDGAIRHEAAGGHSGRHGQWRETAGLAGPDRGS